MSIENCTADKIAALVAENAELRRELADAERRVLFSQSQGQPLGEYLASPYSDPDPAVRAQRYYYAVAGVAELYRRDPHAYHFSPIVHSHPIVQYLPALRDLPWVEMDLPVLRCCRGLTILKIDGWDRSGGITREIAEAEKCGIPVNELTL